MPGRRLQLCAAGARRGAVISPRARATTQSVISCNERDLAPARMHAGTRPQPSRASIPSGRRSAARRAASRWLCVMRRRWPPLDLVPRMRCPLLLPASSPPSRSSSTSSGSSSCSSSAGRGKWQKVCSSVRSLVQAEASTGVGVFSPLPRVLNIHLGSLSAYSGWPRPMSRLPRDMRRKISFFFTTPS